MTRKLYLHPGAPLSGAAQILEIDLSGKQPRIVLDQTLFHVKGGGQLPDLGFIGDAQVVDVRHGVEGNVDHFVEAAHNLVIGQVVPITVDAERRVNNSKLHTAGHLIAGVLAEAFPSVVPVGAHHYPGECRVEFSATQTSVERLQALLPNLLAEAIDADHAVSVLGDPEVNRKIAIGNYPPISCGGTHVNQVASLGNVQITGIKFKDGRMRISYCLAPLAKEESCPVKTV